MSAKCYTSPQKFFITNITAKAPAAPNAMPSPRLAGSIMNENT
jgi:hypothetical protein